MVDIVFAIHAVTRVLRICALYLRHGTPGVQEAIDRFDARQPLARPVRNALEHFDDYQRGRGGSARGQEWFPLGYRSGGDVYLVVPPLNGNEAADLSVSQPLRDAQRLVADTEDADDKQFRERLEKYVESDRGSRGGQTGGLRS
jgi:hypothetical protein